MLLNKKHNDFTDNVLRFCNSLFSKAVIFLLLLKRLSSEINMVSSKGMLVKSYWMSNDAI